MKASVICLAAFSYALLGADAKLLRWGSDQEARRWVPAEQTLPAVFMAEGMGPKPTEAPELPARDLSKRSTNVCGYVNGISSASYYCGTDTCAYNSVSSYVGCCSATGICHVSTVCLDSTQSNLFTTDNGFTRYCWDSAYPHCVTYTYEDAKGYSILGCAVARGTYAIDLSPSVSVATSSSHSTTLPTSTLIVVTFTTTTSTISSPTGDPGSGTPVGAIAGGVVGGVAVLVIIAVGIWFLLRRSKKNKTNSAVTPNTQNQGAPPQPYTSAAPPPQMVEQQHQNHPPPAASAWGSPQTQQHGFVPVHDPRMSMAKNEFDSTYSPTVMSSSPPSSPPPHSPHSPVSIYPHGSPPPPVHQPVGPAYTFVSEMPTQRGDGQVRELAA